MIFGPNAIFGRNWIFDIFIKFILSLSSRKKNFWNILKIDEVLAF